MGIKGLFKRLRNSGRTVSVVDRYHARRAGRHTPLVSFTTSPEPRSIGAYAKGKQLVAGNLQFGGHLVEDLSGSLWTVKSPDIMFEQEIHGSVWLDDLAAVGDSAARALAQHWVTDWIGRYGAGRGPGWAPDLTGRRVIRWINHAVFLMNGQTPENSRKYFASLAHQTNYLSLRWGATTPGLPRFEALTGLLYAGINLDGMGHVLEQASAALDHECSEQLDADGAIATRNPEELLEIFMLLVWASAALRDAGHAPTQRHLGSVEKIASALRTLRHADGSLARFHGGGRGVDGRVDQALAISEVRPSPTDGMAMGYARISAARTTVIADVAKPPEGDISANAHASTLAFELTSGRRPLIVSCGSGAPFGAEWSRAGRSTPSHSTLAIDGVSSSKLSKVDGRELLSRVPGQVLVDVGVQDENHRLVGRHTGYVPSFGLTHSRDLTISADGRNVRGADALEALSEIDRLAFDRHMDRVSSQGVDFSVRFHLHPDVEAELDTEGNGISLVLKSGEVWAFQAGEGTVMSLDPSIFLEKSRLKPRATKQIVLSGRVMEYAALVSWSLFKAQETPSYLRDVGDDLGLTLT
ncbi:MAG: heparinase II/III family protein [Litoreibacter sp.]